MRIRHLRARNYRTLENLDLEFPAYYTALCGKNDSGKTNVVRALQAIMEQSSPFPFYPETEVSMDEDFTKWAEARPEGREVSITIGIGANARADAGLVAFLGKQLSIPDIGTAVEFEVEVSYHDVEPSKKVALRLNGREYTDLAAQEVLKKLQSDTILFYNSTEIDRRVLLGRGPGWLFKDEGGPYSAKIREMKKAINRQLRRITKGHQQELEKLLGRLESKYRISLSLPPFDFSYLPYNISLGQGKVDVALDQWGSGTRNRTLILLTLFRAREVAKSETSAAKITPCIIVEEPESFLHPSAQAAFGRVLQDLAQEFEVQVVTTTHSPYLLSLGGPECNVLLQRRSHYAQLRETFRADTTGENWMHPFSLALGINDNEFRPWRDIFFGPDRSILLVEGDTDKQYFELLRAPEHGPKALKFDGEIYAYGGRDALRQPLLLRFIKDKCRKLFVTFDLDAENELLRTLGELGLQRGVDYLAIGEDAPGKRAIEGLLPSDVTSAVHASEPDLLQQAVHGTTQERKSAQNRLKALYCNEFKRRAKPTDRYYGKFYPVVRVINRALGEPPA